MSALVSNLSPLIDPIFMTSIYSYKYLGIPTISNLTVNPNIDLFDDNVQSTIKKNYVGPVIVTPSLYNHPNTYLLNEYISTLPDLNRDNELQKKFTIYFWKKLRDEWMHDYIKLFKYIVGKKGNYRVVSNETEFRKNKSFDSLNKEDIINYILSEIYTKSMLATSLDKFRTKMNINWWDLRYFKKTLKNFLYYQIKKQIKYLV